MKNKALKEKKLLKLLLAFTATAGLLAPGIASAQYYEDNDDEWYNPAGWFDGEDSEYDDDDDWFSDDSDYYDDDDWYSDDSDYYSDSYYYSSSDYYDNDLGYYETGLFEDDWGYEYTTVGDVDLWESDWYTSY